MSCEDSTATILRDAGHKITPQRMLVLSALRHSGEHVTASQILDEVRRSYPYIDASTVYRTLGSAKELGLITEISLGSGEVQFEWVAGEHHHHLICRVCGCQWSLESSYLDGLATALLDEHGFAAEMDHFAIVGRCAVCREREGE